VTEVLLALAPRPAGVVTGLASFASNHAALGFVSEVRKESEARQSLGVRAIEWADARSLDLLRERGKALESELPPRGSCFVLWEQELARREDEAPALERLDALLGKHDAGKDVRVALPDDERGRRAIAHLREVVPETVNELVSERKRTDPGVRKVAGDMVVPFERLEEMLGHYRSAFERRGLDFAIWGHVSDGNVHANVLARTSGDARSGDEALLELGEIARSLGGAPLSEHGVGKSPTKQRLLRGFLGDQAIADMARTKKALDPRGILAPGNIFPRDALE
jgi:D-lactate dehydrogenase (cytochrome)